MNRNEPWAPKWARVTAWVVLALAVAAAVFLLWVIAEDLSYDGDKFHGLAAGLAGFGLGVLAFAAVPWAWFVRRGGKVVFVAGSALVAALLVLLVTFGL